MTHKLKTTALKSETNVACVCVCGGGDLSCPASRLLWVCLGTALQIEKGFSLVELRMCF